MAAVDIASLSIAELQELTKKIEQRLKQLHRAERTRILSQMEELAAGAGMNPEEVAAHFTNAKKAKKAGTPKYRNPADPTQTWTGRGRKPRWLETLVKKGKKLEDFAIKEQAGNRQ